MSKVGLITPVTLMDLVHTFRSKFMNFHAIAMISLNCALIRTSGRFARNKRVDDSRRKYVVSLYECFYRVSYIAAIPHDSAHRD